MKAFAKCFSRYASPDSERFGSHINLDFAYLAELTRLDHHLRETALPLTLDIERYMKVEPNRMIVDAGDDPHELMASFFNSEREGKVRVLEKRVNLDSVRSKAPTVMGPSGDLAAQDAEAVSSALAPCRMHMVKSEDARGDAAEQLRALRRRFMAHSGHFSRQGQLKNSLAMLSESWTGRPAGSRGHSGRVS